MKKIILFIFICYSILTPCELQAQTKPDALNEYRQGNYERAIQICLDEISTDSRNLDSYVVICWSLLRSNRTNRYDETLRYARIAREINRYDARIIEILGEVYFYLGNNNQAMVYFQEYVNITPAGPRIENVYYYMGEIYIRTGKFRHADISLSTAVHWMPRNAIWWTRLAFARENAGYYDEAVTAYEEALKLNPQSSDARRGLERIAQR